MITIKDIAKLANVSDGTVDRVLHNRGGVSPKTEKKIKEIIDKHNFKLNPIASALASNKKYIVSCLIPNYDSNNMFWKSPYLGILKAQEEVNSFGIHIKIKTFDQFNPISYLQQFGKILKDKPNAVVIAPIFNEETIEITHQLESAGIPYIFINIDNEACNNISFIGQDSYKAGYVAGKLMSISLPQDSLSIIIETRSNVSNYSAITKRIQGFKDYISEHRIKMNIETLSIDLNHLKTSEKIMTHFIESKRDFHGLYIPSSRASSVVKFLSKYKLKLKPIIIGFDTTEKNIKELKNENIQFLISQKSFNQGYECIKIISDYLILKKNPEAKIYSPIQIIIKENVDFNT